MWEYFQILENVFNNQIIFVTEKLSNGLKIGSLAVLKRYYSTSQKNELFRHYSSNNNIGWQ